ncbi:hypothetical protein N0V84_006928 [Fusarium piperis]|uniref:Uncharacterized protein n=1 Tax=Fusarium piperis TaxID=1435070 RepID=A0A9W8WB04_9HYPO|nr:hypothetical protein N0V84_006928 [Fusarium piperis]
MLQLGRFATAMLRLAKTDAIGSVAKGLARLSTTSTAPSDPKDKADTTTQQNADIQKVSVRDFQRLCVDLGLPGELGSKKKCRKEIRSVNVNIGQFLKSKNKPNDVKFFKDKRALVEYTKKTDSFYLKDKLPKGDPLRALLKHMFR